MQFELLLSSFAANSLRSMKKRLAVFVLVAAMAGGSLSSAVAAPSPQVTRLQAKVKRLNRHLSSTRLERDRVIRERNAAWTSIALGLPAQVAAIASSGSISRLAQAVFEPIRLNWPCGSSLFQGQTLWSLDVYLEDFASDEERSCNS